MDSLDAREVHALAEWLEQLRVYAPGRPTSFSVGDRLLVGAMIKAASMVTGQPYTPIERYRCTCDAVRSPNWQPDPRCPYLANAPDATRPAIPSACTCAPRMCSPQDGPGCVGCPGCGHGGPCPAPGATCLRCGGLGV
jgi:hypothetical protein